MKKLFLFAALLMTGFAFYSCDDVVDNPAQDPAQSWNYSVSVKFDNFDFTAQPTDPVTGETNVYKVPTTLYVLNEENTLMGTITTDAAPTVGNYGTYAGTLTGTIGNNLIITTKIGNDLAKQDGTMASAIENGIIQTATVPIKVYNANSGTLTTAAAKMENLTGIAEFKYTGSATDDDKKITFSTDDLNIPGLEKKEFSITLDDAVKPWTNSFYVALGKNTSDAIELQFTADGEERGFILKGKDESFNFDNGKVNAVKNLNMKIASTDLTKYWAVIKADNPTATSANFLVLDDEMTIMQSDSKAVPVIINIMSDAIDKVTLKEVNAQSLQIIGWKNPGKADCEITLDGQSIFNNNTTDVGLKITDAKATFKGTGPLDVTGSNGIYVYGDYKDAENVSQLSELVIDKDVTINATSEKNEAVNIDGGILTLNDGAKKLKATGKTIGIVYSGTTSKFNIGKAVIVEATGVGDNSYGMRLNMTSISIDNKAEITATGGKVGTGIFSYGNWDIKDATKAEDGAKITATTGKDGLGFDYQNGFEKTLSVGKYAKIITQGCPTINADALGRGMSLTGNIILKEYASIKATGCDRYGLYIGNSVSADIAEHATIEAIDAIGDAIQASNFTLKGKGKLIANEAGKNGINITSGTLTFDGAEIEAKGGAGYPAILATGNLAVTSNLVKLTATAGTGSTICISKSDAEAAKADIGTADTDKFNDAVKDGVRTITPIAPAE